MLRREDSLSDDVNDVGYTSCTPFTTWEFINNIPTLSVLWWVSVSIWCHFWRGRLGGGGLIA